MKVFISQPMAGKSDETILKERNLNIALIKMQIESDLSRFDSNDDGVEFIDSFTKPDELVGNRIKMLGHSVMMMADADVCVFLPGWEKSPGCLVEFEVCKQYGIKCFFIQEPMYYLKRRREQSDTILTSESE